MARREGQPPPMAGELGSQHQPTLVELGNGRFKRESPVGGRSITIIDLHGELKPPTAENPELI
ncbi:hypothetical protein A2Z54_03435 [Candidatus Curtissbacteria bacterium RIFCSPHIGHO2_02_39_8]|nr:MAG: hypothetical protein A2Z54_03435 [Candidatus Curtissbacteria bacterium RIFCSPHIGHO2_02_39_8]